MARTDKFTTRARKSLALSQEEAERLGHDYIGSEHLLLGLAAEGEGIAAAVLERVGLDTQRLRAAVQGVAPATGHDVRGNIGLTPEAKEVVELAVKEANRLKHRFVGTEHLLLGVVRQADGAGSRVLRDLDVETSQVVSSTLDILEQVGSVVEREASKGNVVMCRLSDGDLDALDVLIEAGVRSTRSDGAAWLIKAGIKANAELFAAIRENVEHIRETREAARALADQVLGTREGLS
jgi:ATP-dependent Clp protease ATP-binding subunit ClpA